MNKRAKLTQQINEAIDEFLKPEMEMANRSENAWEVLLRVAENNYDELKAELVAFVEYHKAKLRHIREHSVATVGPLLDAAAALSERVRKMLEE